MIDRDRRAAHEPSAGSREQRPDVDHVQRRLVLAGEDAGREARVPEVAGRDDDDGRTAPHQRRRARDDVQVRVSRAEQHHPAHPGAR